MRSKSRRNITRILLILISFVYLFLACDKKEILEPEDLMPSELSDPVPWETLGSGTIVFERIAPYPGKWDGWYVIDVERRKTWNINFRKITYYPEISRNGEKIVFSASAIYIMNVEGTGINKVTETDFGGWPTWTPDGEKIYFRQDYPPRLYCQSAIPNATDLVMVRKFTTQTYPGSPEWIIEPEGKVTVSAQGKIAYACNWNRENGLAGLYTMESDGSDLTLIATLPEGKYFDSPVFSPDGNIIYFLEVERDTSGSYQTMDILKVNVDGTGLQTLITLSISGSKEWACGKLMAVFLTCSPDGHKLLFNLPEGDFVSHLYLINTDGSGLTKVTSAEGVSDRFVSWGS